MTQTQATENGTRAVIARTAIVTGGGRGLGRSIALRLAAEGHAVAVLDRDGAAADRVAAELSAAGAAALAIGVDVAEEAAVAAAVDRVAEQLGAPTILVNNAGILRDNLLFRTSLEDWTSVLDVHLTGAFLLSRAAQAHMVRAGWGRIVNLSSTSALGNRGQANYSAAKAGVQGFTKTLAAELGRFGITTNAVAPGFIETEMTRATAERLGVSFEAFAAGLAETIPVGRMGQPEDVANAVAFFCAEASGFVNGQVLYVSGGPNA